MTETLDIVDEQDNVVGRDTRDHIHRKGLLHREVWVWLFDPKRGILLQRRSKLKDRHPGLLGASIAGHVPAGKGYYETALRESHEEAGLELDESKLYVMEKIRTSTFDDITQTKNETFKQVYAYRYYGRIEDIPLEQNEIDGFEWWSLERLLNPSPSDAKQLSPYFTSTTAQDILKKLWELK